MIRKYTYPPLLMIGTRVIQKRPHYRCQCGYDHIYVPSPEEVILHFLCDDWFEIDIVTGLPVG